VVRVEEALLREDGVSSGLLLLSRGRIEVWALRCFLPLSRGRIEVGAPRLVAIRR